jgi:hypothetical protein
MPTPTSLVAPAEETVGLLSVSLSHRYYRSALPIPGLLLLAYHTLTYPPFTW